MVQVSRPRGSACSSSSPASARSGKPSSLSCPINFAAVPCCQAALNAWTLSNPAHGCWSTLSPSTALVPVLSPRSLNHKDLKRRSLVPVEHGLNPDTVDLTVQPSQRAAVPACPPWAPQPVGSVHLSKVLKFSSSSLPDGPRCSKDLMSLCILACEQ